MNRDEAQRWLDAYIEAWHRNERQPILDLFADDATYSYGPYREPLRGRDAIADDWLKDPDAAGSWSAEYAPVAVEGDTVVAHGTTRYLGEDGAVTSEFDNIFVIRFGPDGRAREFGEWFVERPR